MLLCLHLISAGRKSLGPNSIISKYHMKVSFRPKNVYLSMSGRGFKSRDENDGTLVGVP